MKILTQEDKQHALRRALTSTQGAVKRWSERAATGLSDEDMAKAVRYELGICGGSGCRDSIDIHYEGAGFKIWAAWECFNPYQTEPIFQGQATITAARQLFGVKSPDDIQLDLF